MTRSRCDHGRERANPAQRRRAVHASQAAVAATDVGAALGGGAVGAFPENLLRPFPGTPWARYRHRGAGAAQASRD